MKERIMFYSNDPGRFFDYFKSLETLESVFGIQYAWEDGSFDSEVGDVDMNTVMTYNGIVHTKPLLLSVVYDDAHDLSMRDSFSKATVRPTE